MEAALGFGWLMWRRGRFAYAFALASAVLTYAVGQTPLSPYALAFGSVYFALAVFGLLARLSFADATDMASLASGYPRHLFLLPVRSATLAAWPMIVGSLTLASAWIAFSSVALASRFGPVAVMLPAMGLVALLTSLQAAAWVPLPLPLLRPAMVLLVVGGLTIWGSLVFTIGASPVVIGVGYSGACLASFVVATRGLSRARRGDSIERRWPSLVLRRQSGVQESPPLRSPMEAQVWIESRRNGLTLSIIAGSLSLLLALPTILSHTRPPVDYGPLAYDPTLPIFLLPALLLALLSGFDGGCTSVRDNFREDFSLAPLLEIRPMTDAGIIEAKLRMMVRAVARSGAVLLLGPLLLLLSPLIDSGSPTTVGAYLASHATLRGAVLALAALPLLLLLAWRGTVAAMWLRLSHRAWLRNGVGIAIPSSVLLAAPFVGMRAFNDPTFLPGAMRWLLPTLIVLAVLKVGAVFLVTRRVRALDLVPLRTMVRWAITCTVLASGLLMAARWLSPVPVPLGESALGLFLLLPLVRVQLAVLVLHDNRHR